MQRYKNYKVRINNGNKVLVLCSKYGDQDCGKIDISEIVGDKTIIMVRGIPYTMYYDANGNLVDISMGIDINGKLYFN